MSQWDLHLGVENADWTKKIKKKKKEKKEEGSQVAR